jgi:hypothetical protein
MAPILIAVDKSYDLLINSNDIKKSKINVDGDDYQLIKKMERLNPQLNIIHSYFYFLSEPTKIYDRVYLGSAYNASCWYTLEKLNIKYIINVTSEISNYYQSQGIEYYRIPIKDNNNESMIEYFDISYQNINNFLENNNGNVLIHCYMGASRSATIAAMFLSKKTNVDITEIIENLKIQRPLVNPTQQFIKDLIDKTS